MTSRLRRRLETERLETERTAARELRLLGESLRGVAKSALRTLEADTAAWSGRVRTMLLRAWLLPLMVGLSLSLGISAGSWAAMRSLWTTIEQQMETSAALDVDIEEARATLARIEAATWGVTLREIDGERFVVLPAGTLTIRPGPWAGGLP